jgi:hypothetical protein
MKPCEGNLLAVSLYLDDELAVPGRTALESHLCICIACREAVAGERRWRNELRSLAPLYRAPDSLRSRVEGIIRDAPVHASARLRARD